MTEEEIKTKKILKLMHNKGLSYLEAENEVELEEHRAWVEEMMAEAEAEEDRFDPFDSHDAYVEGYADWLAGQN